jgi:hypothetical protein
MPTFRNKNSDFEGKNRLSLQILDELAYKQKDWNFMPRISKRPMEIKQQSTKSEQVPLKHPLKMSSSNFPSRDIRKNHDIIVTKTGS